MAPLDQEIKDALCKHTDGSRKKQWVKQIAPGIKTLEELASNANLRLLLDKSNIDTLPILHFYDGKKTLGVIYIKKHDLGCKAFIKTSQTEIEININDTLNMYDDGYHIYFNNVNNEKEFWNPKTVVFDIFVNIAIAHALRPYAEEDLDDYTHK